MGKRRVLVVGGQGGPGPLQAGLEPAIDTDVAEIQVLAPDTGCGDGLEHELQDFDIAGHAVVAEEFGAHLERIPRTVERIGARAQHRAHVAETRGCFALELVCVDAGNLRRRVGANAHHASGELVGQLECLGIEIAAGAAGLAKMVLALHHRRLPPHLHFREPNPDIDLEAGHLVIDTAAVPWQRYRDGSPRICGVSSFGLSGTNAHVVLEEPERGRVGQHHRRRAWAEGRTQRLDVDQRFVKNRPASAV